jgi:ADP-ribose pyrophosphatase YjhB (NUDIX family)
MAAAEVGKVTALITRLVDGRPELCVFDHAGWVQIPAGTLEAGEHPIAGVVREAWEETGLPRLEVVARLATVEDGNRAVFHLRATEPVPDEWWVLTPDGSGSQWRCRWIPLDDVDGMHERQRAWIDEVRDLLDVDLPIDRLEHNPDGTDEVFDATNGIRLLITPIDTPPTNATLGSSYGVCVTADGDAVVVTHDAAMGWSLPGGRPEPGETAAQTFAREVLEEACARVIDAEVVMTTEDRFLADDRRVHRQHVTSLFWARVELDDWAPAHEMVERRLVPLADLADELRWEIPTHLQLHRLAFDREGRA